MSFSWYLNRVRTMSPPEILFRFGQFLQKKREKKKQVGLFPEVTLESLPIRILPSSSSPVDLENSTISIFGIPFDYDQPIDWHEDISSGRHFPMSFAKDINIRTEQYGSAKHVWEVNRMQFLTLVALKYQSTQDEKYLKQFQEIVESWIVANPFLTGVNWYSNIEVNIRLIVWFFCWEILDASELVKKNKRFKAFVEDKWVPCIYLHCKYSHNNPSFFSSANNHLISEYAGLYIAASYWHFKESHAWKKEAKQGLEEEIINQHSAAGVNKEEASEYIQFITDFFLFSHIVGEYTKDSFSTAYQEKLHMILEYIYQMMDINGNVPYYGDEDDGKVNLFNHDAHFDNFKSLLTTGSVLFHEPKWKAKSNGFDEKNQLLLGKGGENIFESIEIPSAKETSKYYPDQGHFIFRKQDDAGEIYMHVDAAPLGFLSIAAHGHADALSYIMHIDGQPLLVDAGTYTYHTEPEWRSYFIGTLAHNTIRVDQTDQALSTGPTMWLKHFDIKLIDQQLSEQQDLLRASHNGYESMGIIHQREVKFVKDEDVFIVTDHLHFENHKERVLEMPFHLHPEAKIEKQEENKYILSHPKARTVEIVTDQQLSYDILRGQESPILGWYSPSFQIKEPTTVLYGKSTADKSTTFVTKIKVLNN